MLGALRRLLPRPFHVLEDYFCEVLKFDPKANDRGLAGLGPMRCRFDHRSDTPLPGI